MGWSLFQILYGSSQALGSALGVLLIYVLVFRCCQKPSNVNALSGYPRLILYNTVANIQNTQLTVDYFLDILF